MQGILRFLGRNGGQTFPVTLQIGSASLPLRAFCDTGFSVQEPLSGREVVLVRFAAVQNALPGPLRTYLSAYFAAPSTLPPPELGLRFVPCTTVSGHCILPAVPAVRLRLRLSRSMQPSVTFRPRRAAGSCCSRRRCARCCVPMSR